MRARQAHHRLLAGAAALLLALAGLAAAGTPPARARTCPAPPASFITSAPATAPRTVALTFDDGPNPVDTPRLLEVLRRHEVRAVFFLLGQFALKYPDIVQAIAADGHRLGNHGMHHDDLTDWPEDRIEADLRAATEAIQAAVPDRPVAYFRAPYGLWGRSPKVAAALGMRPVGWRLAVGDWQQRKA